MPNNFLNIENENLWLEPVSKDEFNILESDSLSVVFIDSAVEDSQTLVDNISGATEVIVLNSTEDELIQISQHLSQYQKLDAVHIVSHGEAGSLWLGNTELSQDTLPKYTDILKNWDNFLDAEADIVLYGCNIAHSEDGNSFIQSKS